MAKLGLMEGPLASPMNTIHPEAKADAKNSRKRNEGMEARLLIQVSTKKRHVAQPPRFYSQLKLKLFEPIAAMSMNHRQPYKDPNTFP